MECHFPSAMAALLIPALAAGIGFKSMKFAWDTAKHSHLFARKHHHHHSAAAVLPTTPAAMPVETGQGLRRRKRHPRKPKRKLPRRNTASAARLSGGVEHFTYACVPARCRFYRMTSLCPGLSTKLRGKNRAAWHFAEQRQEDAFLCRTPAIQAKPTHHVAAISRVHGKQPSDGAFFSNGQGHMDRHPGQRDVMR